MYNLNKRQSMSLTKYAGRIPIKCKWIGISIHWLRLKPLKKKLHNIYTLNLFFLDKTRCIQYIVSNNKIYRGWYIDGKTLTKGKQ